LIAKVASRAAAVSESFAALRANNAWRSSLPSNSGESKREWERKKEKEKEKERERERERERVICTVLWAGGRGKPLLQPHTILLTLLRLPPPGRRGTGQKQRVCTDIVPRTSKTKVFLKSHAVDSNPAALEQAKQPDMPTLVGGYTHGEC
jgi:hypothetical protein